MDQQQQQGQGQKRAPPYGSNPYLQPPSKMMMVQGGPSSLAAYQHIQQQQQEQLQQQLRGFWAGQSEEVEQASEFKNHSLPLARIKKIMKADEDVRMISAEAPVVFARACEMFILELTLRSWNHTEENKRRTLQKNDIAAAITRTDIFDFLVDIVPREDLKDEAAALLSSSASALPLPLPLPGPAEGVPYYYMPPPVGPPPPPQGMIGGGYAPPPWPHQPQHPPPGDS